jgi:sporulation-control protein spo0M
MTPSLYYCGTFEEQVTRLEVVSFFGSSFLTGLFRLDRKRRRKGRLAKAIMSQHELIKHLRCRHFLGLSQWLLLSNKESHW